MVTTTKLDGLIERVTAVETFTTRQKVYAGIAAVVASASVNGAVGFLFHWLK